MGTGEIFRECKHSEGQLEHRFLLVGGSGQEGNRGRLRDEAGKLSRGWILKSPAGHA